MEKVGNGSFFVQGCLYPSILYTGPWWCCVSTVVVLVEVNGRNIGTRTMHRYSGYMNDQWIEGRVQELIIVLTCVDIVNLKYNLVKIIPIMGNFLSICIIMNYQKLKVK